MGEKIGSWLMRKSSSKQPVDTIPSVTISSSDTNTTTTTTSKQEITSATSVSIDTKDIGISSNNTNNNNNNNNNKTTKDTNNNNHNHNNRYHPSVKSSNTSTCTSSTASISINTNNTTTTMSHPTSIESTKNKTRTLSSDTQYNNNNNNSNDNSSSNVALTNTTDGDTSSNSIDIITATTTTTTIQPATSSPQIIEDTITPSVSQYSIDTTTAGNGVADSTTSSSSSNNKFNNFPPLTPGSGSVSDFSVTPGGGGGDGGTNGGGGYNNTSFEDNSTTASDNNNYNKIDTMNRIGSVKRLVSAGNEKAETIRARLRDQEQRLSKLVSSRRSSLANDIDDKTNGTTELNKLSKDEINAIAMEEVRETLRQVAAEKLELEQKLEYLQLQHAEDEVRRQEEMTQVLNARSAKQLENVKFSDEHDAFLRSKLAGIQKGFQEQNNKLQQLQDAIVTKDNEINMLQLELHTKLKTIIDLEYDVTCHAIHYTEYSQQQYQLGNDAMKELNEYILLEASSKQQHSQQHNNNNNNRHSQQVDDTMSSDSNAVISNDSTWMGSATGTNPHYSSQQQQNLHGTKPITSTSTLHPRRAKKLISKLLADLDHLEELYKNEKLKAIEMKNELSKENELLKVNVITLESEKHKLEQQQQFGPSDPISLKKNKRDKNNNKSKQVSLSSSSSASLPDSPYEAMEQLRKRIAVLEAVRFLYRKEIYDLRQQLEQVRDDANNEKSKHIFEKTRLQLAYETLQRRCTTLEIDILGNSDHSSSTSTSPLIIPTLLLPTSSTPGTTTGSMSYSSPHHGINNNNNNNSRYNNSNNNVHIDDGISALDEDDEDDDQSSTNYNNKPPYLINTSSNNNNNSARASSQTVMTPLSPRGKQQHYKTIEKRIIDCYNDIARLEADSEIKDLQILDLKKEIYQLRQNKIASGNITGGVGDGSIDPELYTEYDTTILSTMDSKVQQLRTIVYTDEEIGKELDELTTGPNNNSTTMTGGEDSGHTAEITDSSFTNILFNTSANSTENLIDDGIVLETNFDATAAKSSMTTCIKELRNQLAKVKKELAEKDQELMIERAKSSCMAANLLDRIEALDKQLEDDSDNTEITNALRETDEEEDQIDDNNNNDDDDDVDDGTGIRKSASGDSKSGKKGKKDRKKIFGRIPLRFYL